MLTDSFQIADAITETGEIVNIDGAGTRVAMTSYGRKPAHIVDKNKITPTLESALYRDRHVANRHTDRLTLLLNWRVLTRDCAPAQIHPIQKLLPQDVSPQENASNLDSSQE